jgi:pimeloyl-ACP methyl ester carboxylesterase
MKSGTTRAPRCVAVALLLIAAHTGTTAWADDVVQVREIGSFYVGGRSVSLRGLAERPRVRRSGAPAENIDPNGDFQTGQIYVQFVRLAKPYRLPLLLLPGGSVTGVTYETTPDGRAGWQLLFLQRGYSVYIADTAQAGRAPWARFPEINADEPVFRSAQFLWEVFRIGPEGSFAASGGPKSYGDTRFPVSAFRELLRQAAPRFRAPRDEERKGYEELLAKVCPCIVLAHSAAGLLALDAMLGRPELVAGVVLLEPFSAPEASEAVRAKAVPHLFIWGDHLDLNHPEGSWAKQYFGARRYHDALRASGGRSTWVYLPDRGVRGNSHMLMMDNNSAEIAELIHDWIRHTL